MDSAALIFPHQLFENHPSVRPGRPIFIAADPLFFGNDPTYPVSFHKQKLVLHHASMHAYADELSALGHTVEIIPHTTTFQLALPRGISHLHLADPVDFILEKRLRHHAKASGTALHISPSPNFLTPADFLEKHIKGKSRPFMATFYKAQRKRMNILIEKNGEPTGGRWSFDDENRKKLPKNHTPPPAPSTPPDRYVAGAIAWTEKHFPDNPGNTTTFRYPVTRTSAKQWLKNFLQERLREFGPYEDAISTRHPFINHSLLTPALNIGLLSPGEIVHAALRPGREIPINSLEGFIRQIIGWREFMHGIYLHRGVGIRTSNFLGHTRPIPPSFYNGTTGIPPIDRIIRQLHTDAYAHHIERLMILGNFMLLCRFHPDAVYKWFMELFIDSYDWVMVPNVYGMSQHLIMETEPTTTPVDTTPDIQDAVTPAAGTNADLGQRILGGFIDFLVAFALSYILGQINSGIGFIAAVGYWLVRDSLPFLNGVSVGKMVAKTKAVTETGASLSGDWKTGVLRNFPMAIPVFNLVELIILIKETWAAYRKGSSGLLHAPTGQGKTMAVYLAPLVDSLRITDSCAILWITPLRALAADTLRALREPQQFYNPKLKAEARTGDTPANIRARLRKKLPHTLVTTPESLSLMLTHTDMREKLANLQCVIVDEWHELLGSKRGVQTELCLARLRTWLPSLRTWALSATLGNLQEAANTISPAAGKPPAIVSARLKKKIIIETIIPREIDTFPWSGHIGTSLAPQVIRHLEQANTTLLFTNTRSQTEIWFQEILALRPDWAKKIAMHHGSLDRAERDIAENGLRDGSLKCVVATSSLDLGVDFSPVDQVIQIGSPKGIARLLQRAGRSGHQPGADSRILGVPTNALELIEFAAARRAAKTKQIESRPPLSKPLDVLVQHLVTCAIGEPFLPQEMLAEIRSTHAYRNLTATEWEWALTFITVGGKALAAYPRYRKVHIDSTGRYSVTEKRLITRHRISIGTITSDSHIILKFANGQTLGSVEENFISKLRPNTTFIFAGRHLTFVRLRHKTATVKPSAKTNKGRIAIWGGAKMSLSTELTHAFSDLISPADSLPRAAVPPELKALTPLLTLQKSWSQLPTDHTLLIEHTRSREGEHLFLYPFAGRLVHEGLAALLAFRISRQTSETITTTQNDYGFSLNARRKLPFAESSFRQLLSTEHLLDDLLECMNTAELARRQFREIARVSGLILQPMPGRQPTSQRELQSSSTLLYEVLQRYDPENLLLAQAEREILEKQLELTRLSASLEKLRTQPFILRETKKLTPFAFPLWADRLQSMHIGPEATTRLEAMLQELHAAS
eukprot:g3787.t1